MTKPLRDLLIEDSENDALLILRNYGAAIHGAMRFGGCVRRFVTAQCPINGGTSWVFAMHLRNDGFQPGWARGENVKFDD